MITSSRNKFRVNTFDPTFSQMLEQIEAEEKLNAKKKLIEKASRATFKLKFDKDEFQPTDESLDIYLDPSLSNEEKRIK